MRGRRDALMPEFDYYEECNYNDDLVDYDKDVYW